MIIMDLEFKIKKTIEKDSLFEAGDHLLVAVSGGIDSMVMAHLLFRLKDHFGVFLSVVHINHKLRGLESDQDADFVKQFAKKIDLPCTVVNWKGPVAGENLQEAARIFRFDTFVKTATKVGAKKVVLAHNENDQAETVFLYFIRGAGLEGITGMEAIKTLKGGITVLRPLLSTSRKEIEEYAVSNKVKYREDRSNDETKYTRNFIRHEVMPIVEKMNPQVIPSLAKMAAVLRRDEAYLQKLVEVAFDRLKVARDKDKLELDAAMFGQLEVPIRTRLLKRAYIEINGSVMGLTRDHIEKMDEIAVEKKPHGSYELPNSMKFEKNSMKLAIFRK